MKKMRVVGIVLAWAGMVAAQGQVAGQTAGQAGKADSSAALRNDKQNGAAKRAMTFADLMAMKRVSDPQVSPSGTWVMFSVTDVSLEKNTKVNHLWVVALNPTHDDKAVKDEVHEGGISVSQVVSVIVPQAADSSGERQVTYGSGESNGRFSPDGMWVTMTTKDQIYVAPWDEAAGKVGTAVQVTSVTGGADGAIWSPDSKRLMFVADVYPECSVKGGDRAKATARTSANEGILRSAQNDNRGGGENDNRGGGVIAGAEPETWTEEDACDKAKDEAAAASPVKAQVWDELLYRHWDHYTGEKRSHILVVDADGGGSSKSNDGVRDLTPASAVGDAETPTWMLGGPLEYAWAPDSKEIAYVTNVDKVPAASTNNDVFTLRIDEPGAKAVKVSTSPGSDDAPAYSPDGRWLAFRSQKQAGFESDRFRLMLYDREKKTISELMPKFDNWVDEFMWVPDSNGIYFASGNQGEESIFRFFLSNQELQQMVNVGEYGDLRLTQDGKLLVASRMELNSPSELVVLEPGEVLKISPEKTGLGTTVPSVVQTGLMHALSETHLNDSVLNQLDLPKMESFWFVGAEGTKVQGFILRPPGFDPAKKYPVKFVMHGGPQTALGDSWSYRWNWELLAADGYVVVGINRRGSTGYGQKFVDEVSGDWGGRAYQDLMKGLDYAEATYPFLDKTRECALGASYGGFMADWVLTHTNRFQCIVTHDGMVDPVSAYGTTEEMWFNEWEFRRPEDFPKGWDGFSASYNPMGGIKADSSAALRNDKQIALRNDKQIALRNDKQIALRNDKQIALPNDKQNALRNDKQEGGHAAEPWRYQSLAAEQDPFRKWSALRAIENAKTPTLIIHSQKDYRLDVSQGFELYTALQRRGVPARFLYFPDEGHWVLKPQNSQLWYETVDDWCDRWTKTGKYAEKQ
jgi:dipeptidyl aminopeptidase/acylaminoacyl peptidase